MNVNYLENALRPVLAAQGSLSGVAELVKELLTRPHIHDAKMSYWQLILAQSKANGCFYHGDELAEIKWEWPKNTWFQERLGHRLKDLEFVAQ